MRRELYRKESVIREWGVICPSAIYITRGFLFISRKPQDFLKPRKKEESFEVLLAYHVFKADTIRRTEVDRNFEYSANFAESWVIKTES